MPFFQQSSSSLPSITGLAVTSLDVVYTGCFKEAFFAIVSCFSDPDWPDNVENNEVPAVNKITEKFRSNSKDLFMKGTKKGIGMIRVQIYKN